MHTSIRRVIFAAFVIFFSFGLPSLWAQSAGNAGTIVGTVTDPTGAIVPNAAVSILNPVSGYSKTTTSDDQGHYQFTNLPLPVSDDAGSRLVGGLSDLDDVAVRITDVAADLAVLLDWLRDELGAATFP